MDISELSKYWPILTVLAPIFFFWDQVKGIFHKLFNLFVIEIDLQNEASDAVAYMLLNHSKPFSFGFNSYIGIKEYIRPIKKNAIVGLKKTSAQSGLFFLGKYPIFVAPGQAYDKDEGHQYSSRFKIYFIRGTFNPDELVESAIDKYNHFYTKQASRFNINIITGTGNKSVLDEGRKFHEPKTTFDESFYYNKILKYNLCDLGYGSEKSGEIPYVFCKESEKILNDILIWKNSEDWYRSRGILWRRGSLLYGIPGSGKTATIRACAQKLDLPLYIFDLASLSNAEFVEKWRNMLSSIPCVAVFEDIDSVFNGRTNIIGESGGGLSFDCLLNAIGGALPAEGIYTFVTTNNVEKLDNALGVPDKDGKSSRNGRLDNMIEIGYITKDSKERIAKKIFAETDMDISKYVDIEENITTARFVEICGQDALRLYWEKHRLTKSANETQFSL